MEKDGTRRTRKGEGEGGEVEWGGGGYFGNGKDFMEGNI